MSKRFLKSKKVKFFLTPSDVIVSKIVLLAIRLLMNKDRPSGHDLFFTNSFVQGNTYAPV